MPATSILIFIVDTSFDTTLGYNINAQYTDNDNPPNVGRSDTFFTIEEAAPVVNARIIKNCKDDHNANFGSNFTIATPSVLVGALV